MHRSISATDGTHKQRGVSVIWMMWLACSGSEDPSPQTTGDTGDTPVEYEASWEGVQQLFVDHCDSCHPATNSVDLRANIDTYVIAGNPESSRLWEALIGVSLSTMMPPSGRLPAETIAPVEAWILAGAPR
jgi:hypothetical protein